ncbi:MAG: ACT domain-containing protein [Clostridiales bacterium]|nr:ACT domain-containing protein [Clostridiales bacterium]
MEDTSKYLIVDKGVLPEVFLKVIDAKRLVATEGLSVSDAAAAVGISRSAFYKYRDNVFLLGENRRGSTVIVALDLDHRPGLLSNVLNTIADFGANILTINQTIPINGVANVTISAELNSPTQDADGLIQKLKGIRGVLALKIIARE